MNDPKTRLCIYPKDVMLITGKSYNTALRLLQNIRKAYRKSDEALITYAEFCDFTNLDEEEIVRFLK